MLLTMEITENKERKWYLILFFPFLFVLVMLLVKLFELVLGINFYEYGIYPRKIKGLAGILFAPILHGDALHVISNAIPLLVLGGGLFYYFKDLGYKIFFSIYFATGLWVWVAARPSYHIGASGVVYGLVTFFILSAILRKNKHLLFFSFLVIFLYGGLIWGIFPIKAQISWESHLMGAIAGLFMAWYYRNIGIQKEKYSWELNPESDDEVDFDWSGNPNPLEEDSKETIKTENDPIKIVYHIRGEGEK
jgi:membrane associated rhomboid family serine protease